MGTVDSVGGVEREGHKVPGNVDATVQTILSLIPSLTPKVRLAP